MYVNECVAVLKIVRIDMAWVDENMAMKNVALGRKPSDLLLYEPRKCLCRFIVFALYVGILFARFLSLPIASSV